ncbi:MAG: porin family protein [Hyphomonadaceae bacterium]|nr:porin family protein [Hyphomonadaceae bacterium]MBC6411587.1 porin family protein [Hyphomonadaceae bacterium]
MKTTILTGICAFALLGGTAYAQENERKSRPVPTKETPKGYISGGAIMYDIDSSNFGAQVRGGYNFHPNFALEGEASLGLVDEDGDFTNASDGVDWHIGGFAVAKVPVSGNSSVFVRGGYFYGEYSIDDDRDRYKVDFDLDGFAYGAGVEIGINDRNSIRLEYTAYDFRGEPEGDAGDEGSVSISGGLPSLAASWVYRF